MTHTEPTPRNPSRISKSFRSLILILMVVTAEFPASSVSTIIHDLYHYQDYRYTALDEMRVFLNFEKRPQKPWKFQAKTPPIFFQKHWLAAILAPQMEVRRMKLNSGGGYPPGDNHTLLLFISTTCEDRYISFILFPSSKKKCASFFLLWWLLQVSFHLLLQVG